MGPLLCASGFRVKPRNLPNMLTVGGELSVSVDDDFLSNAEFMSSGELGVVELPKLGGELRPLLVLSCFGLPKMK